MSDNPQSLKQVDSATALKVRKQPQPGDVLDGIYRLDQQLGRGGVGVVFRAWHLHLQRPCAVKFLHPQLVTNPELRTRFRREAQSAFQLGHPHIVAITDFRDDPNSWPYLVMELVEGETLRDRLERGPLPPPVAVRLMAELCDALYTAHRRGVIHRDLKPENLFLTGLEAPDAGESEVILKVLDFGLSKLLDGAEITGSGRLLGSPSYMSPEQARGDSHLVDVRSDIFSVGALLYECLTGDKLFQHENFEQKRQAIIAAKLPPLRLMERGMPPQLEKIITKACSRLPEQRYQTAAALMEALSNVYPSHGIKPVGRREAAADRRGQANAASLSISIDQSVGVKPDGKPKTPDTISAGGEMVASGIENTPRRSPVWFVVAAASITLIGVLSYIGYTHWQAGNKGATVTPVPVQTSSPARPVVTPIQEPPQQPALPPTPPAPSPTEAAPGTAPAAQSAEDKPSASSPAAPAGAETAPAPGDVATTSEKPAPGAPHHPTRRIHGPKGPGSQLPGVPPLAGGDEAPQQNSAPTVDMVLRRSVPSLLHCFSDQVPPPHRLSVDITLRSDGRVTEASTDSLPEEQSACVLSVLRKLRFAPLTDGDTYSAHYEFVNLHR